MILLQIDSTLTEESEFLSEVNPVPEGAREAGWVLRVTCMKCDSDFGSAQEAYSHHLEKHTVEACDESLMSIYEDRVKDVRLMECEVCDKEMEENKWEKHLAKCSRKRKINSPERLTHSRAKVPLIPPLHCKHGPLTKCRCRQSINLFVKKFV